MKTIEDVQRFKEDKCSILLQTAECCDINEMLEQLKHHKLRTNKNSSEISNERNYLLKKYHQNYLTMKRQNNNFTSNSQTSNMDSNMHQKSVGSGFKLYPKFIQNIDSMGFEKPNWKPLMLNDKSESQFSSLNITNSFQSFQSKGKISRASTRNSNRLDSLINSDTHKQKSIEMNLKREKNYEQLSSSDSMEDSFEVDQESEIRKKVVKSHKQLLLGGSSNRHLKSVQLLSRQGSSFEIMRNENSNSLDSTSQVNLPPLRQNSDQPGLIESGSIIYTSNKTPRFAFIEREKTREASLVNIISISKITPSNSKEQDGTIETEKVKNKDDEKKSISQIFSDILRQKTDLENYMTSIKNNTEKSYVPPNTPQSSDHYSRAVTPELEEQPHLLVAINDPKAFPPSKTLINQTKNRARSREAFLQESSMNLIVSNKDSSPSQPLIKSSYNSNNKGSKLEKNFQKKIGETSINMIKINNKSVRFVSNNANNNNINNTNINSINNHHTDSMNGFDKTKNKQPIVHPMHFHQANDKVFVNIYIPNLS